MGIKSRAPSIEEDTFKIDGTKDTIENRTAEAGNQNVVFFNRVPKPGSEMFEHFTKLMSQVLGYHVYFDPQVMALLPTDIENKGFAQKFRQNINETGVYFRHTPFFNFTRWHV